MADVEDWMLFRSSCCNDRLHLLVEPISVDEKRAS